MVIGAAYQNPGLFHADFLHQLKVLFAGTDPACHLRELIPPLHTFINRIPVLFTVQKKFTGSDHAVRAAKPM